MAHGSPGDARKRRCRVKRFEWFAEGMLARDDGPWVLQEAASNQLAARDKRIAELEGLVKWALAFADKSLLITEEWSNEARALLKGGAE